MAVLSRQMVMDLATEMNNLEMTRETISGVVHMLDSMEQAQEMLEYLRTEKPTDEQILFRKMEEIIGLEV